MKTIKKYKLEKDIVYNLNWICPECNIDNLEYYFQDWKYKKILICRQCYKRILKGDINE